MFKISILNSFLQLIIKERCNAANELKGQSKKNSKDRMVMNKWKQTFREAPEPILTLLFIYSLNRDGEQ